MILAHKLECRISDLPAEPDENWYDAQDVLAEQTNAKYLEVLWNEETQRWEKQ